MQDFAGVVKLYRDSSIHDQEIADEFKHILKQIPSAQQWVLRTKHFVILLIQRSEEMF